MVGVATVRNYLRSDGTSDLGIDHTKPILDIDRFLVEEVEAVNEIKAGLQRDEAMAAAVGRVLQKAEQGLSGEMFVFSRGYALEECRENLNRALLYWNRTVEATRSRLDSGRHFGKPKGLNLKMPKCRRRPVASFG